MNKIMNIAQRFREEEDGAAMVEYSILIGIIAVASIATIAAVGTWVTGSFKELCNGLVKTGNNAACATPTAG